MVYLTVRDRWGAIRIQAADSWNVDRPEMGTVIYWVDLSWLTGSMQSGDRLQVVSG